MDRNEVPHTKWMDSRVKLVRVLLVISFPVLVRNLSAKHKWLDALSEGVNGLGCCGGRGALWGDADAGDRSRVSSTHRLLTKEKVEKGKAEVSGVVLIWIAQNGFVSPLRN